MNQLMIGIPSIQILPLQDLFNQRTVIIPRIFLARFECGNAVIKLLAAPCPCWVVTDKLLVQGKAFDLVGVPAFVR